MTSIYKYLKIYLFQFYLVYFLIIACNSQNDQNNIIRNNNKPNNSFFRKNSLIKKGFDIASNSISYIKEKSELIRPKKSLWKNMLSLASLVFIYKSLNVPLLVNSDSKFFNIPDNKQTNLLPFPDNYIIENINTKRKLLDSNTDFNKGYLNFNTSLNSTFLNNSIFNRAIFNDLITISNNKLAAVGYFNIKWLSNLIYSILDLDGNPLSNYFFSGEGDDRGISILETKDRNLSILFITSSYSNNHQNFDIGLVQTFGDGKNKNFKIYQRNYTSYPNAFIQDKNYNYYIGGFINDPTNTISRKNLILKTDIDFKKKFAKSYYYENSISQLINDIIEFKNGFAITGRVIIKFNNSISTNLYINAANDTDIKINLLIEQDGIQEGKSITQIENDLVTVGYSTDSLNQTSSIIANRINNNDNILWNYLYHSPNNDRALSVFTTKSNLLIMAGDSIDPDTNEQYAFALSLFGNGSVHSSKIINGIYDSGKVIIEAQDETHAIGGSTYIEEFDLETFLLSKIIPSNKTNDCKDFPIEKREVAYNISSPLIHIDNIEFSVINITDKDFKKMDLAQVEKDICFTESPTNEPIFQPSNNPTSDPTFDPSIDPTSDPTFDPSMDPTSDPTFDPSMDPTSDPVSNFINKPAFDPTYNPSIDPTFDPSIDPTFDPSIDPTFDPSIDPTFDPSINPTITSNTFEPINNTIDYNHTYEYNNTNNLYIKTTSGNESTISPTKDPMLYSTTISNNNNENTEESIKTTSGGNESTKAPTLDPIFLTTKDNKALLDPSKDPTFHPTTYIDNNKNNETEDKSKKEDSTSEDNSSEYLIPLIISLAAGIICLVILFLICLKISNSWNNINKYEDIETDF